MAEILRAFLMAAVPVGVFTFALVWWALRGGHFAEALDAGKLRAEMQAMAKAHKKSGRAERRSRHPVQRKWASFGGGFYGIVAFFTWIVIEARDIAATIANFGGLWDFLSQLNIGVIVDMLMEAVFNFVAAIAWPLYWMSNIDTRYSWAWFVAAYAGYWVGLRLAQKAYRERKPGE